VGESFPASPETFPGIKERSISAHSGKHTSALLLLRWLYKSGEERDRERENLFQPEVEFTKK